MFEKKKKATKKNEDLMKKAPAADAVELSDDVLEAAAGGFEIREVWSSEWSRSSRDPDGTPTGRSYSLEGVDARGRDVCIDDFRTESAAYAYAKEHGIE